MDDVDIANEMTEKMLKAYIDAAKDVPLVIEGDGYCLNCGEIVEFGRWCDIDCLHDWQLRR